VQNKTGSEPLAQSFLAQWPRKKVEILKFNTQGDHSPGNVKFADISRPFVAFIYKCHTWTGAHRLDVFMN